MRVNIMKIIDDKKGSSHQDWPGIEITGAETT